MPHRHHVPRRRQIAAPGRPRSTAWSGAAACGPPTRSRRWRISRRRIRAGRETRRRQNTIRGEHERAGRKISVERNVAASVRRRPDQGGPHRDGGAIGARFGEHREPRGGHAAFPRPRRPPPRGSCRNTAACARGRRGRRRQGIPGPWRRGLRRAAHRVGREIRVRQFGQRGRAVLRGAGRPAAAQIHPDAARGPRRRDGVGLHQGLRRARDRDEAAGRHGQRHRPDVQRLQGADAARRLFLSHRSVASRRPRRLRGGAESGADGPADHQVHLAGAPSR